MIKLGAKVRVKKPLQPGYLRVPSYVIGKYGVIVYYHSAYPCAEDIGVNKYPRLTRLYAVAFDFYTLWGESSKHEVIVDLYEHWLDVEITADQLSKMRSN